MITGLIVSAGKSTRMGEFKPLMNYRGKSFIHQIISNIDSVCQQIIIVTGYNTGRLKNQVISTLKESGQEHLLNKIRFVENSGYEEGMFTSLQKGLKVLVNSKYHSVGREWLIYHFVDQPGLPAEFYPDFINQIDDLHNWIQPSYKGQNGHPLLLRDDLFGTILGTDAKSSLREVSRQLSVKRKIWECHYKNILQDLDTRENYLSDKDQ